MSLGQPTRAFLLLLCGLACSDATGTGDLSTLTVDLRLAPTVVQPGDSFTATLVLTNTGTREVSVRSRSSCLTSPEVQAGGSRVEMEGAGPAICLPVITSHRIDAGDSLVRSFPLVAWLREAQSPWDYVVPPPAGSYQVRLQFDEGLPEQTKDFQVVP